MSETHDKYKTAQVNRWVGHYDGLFCLAVVATASAAAFPWLENRRWPDSAFAVVTFGIQCGWFALLHLWVLLGNHSLVRRLAVGFGWSLPAAIAMALHFDNSSPSDEPSQLSMFLAIRVAAIIGVVLLGLAIRPLCRWRIGDGSGHAEEKRGVQIWDLFVLTFCCGLVLASVRPVLLVIEQDDLDRFIQYTVCELAPFVVLLWGFGAACLWRRLEPHLFWVVPCIGITASYLAFASPLSNPIEWISYELRSPPLDEEGFFLMASCSMVVVLAGLLWARTLGYQICERYSPTVNEPARSPWRPASTTCLAVLCISYFAVHLFFDMPTFYRQDEAAWATARRIKTASRLIGRSPTSVGKKRFSWETDESKPQNRLTISNGEFSYSVTDAQDLAGLVKQLVEPNAEGISLETSYIDAELLRAFAGLKQAGWVNLKGECDPKALREFLQGKKMESLVVRPMTAELASAIRDEANVDQMTVYHVDGKPDLVDVLRQLPIRSLDLSIEQPNDLDLHGFNKLQHLEFVGTEITTNVVEQLEACPKLSSLTLKGCSFPTEAVKRMASLPVESIEIHCDVRQDLSLKPLAEWADNDHLTSLQLNVPWVSDHFLTKFNLRRGMVCCHARDRWELDPDEVAQEKLDLVSTVEKMAHRCERDEQGHITKLDLQWLLLDEDMADAIGKLPHLRELRYSSESNPYRQLTPRNCLYLERNKKILLRLLAEGNLTTLELPTETIDQEVLREIGQLTQLKRLQLPTVVEDIAFPERIPMPFQLSEYRLVEILHITHRHELTTNSRDANYSRIRSVLDPSLIMGLARLKQLEYLFVPGFMIDATSLPTILGFTKLKHFHAPFSNFDAKDLQSLAQLKRLKSLTLGLHVDEILHLDELQSMTDLRTLQLFLYGDETNEQQREKFRREIEQFFPEAELHLHFLPKPSDESY